MSLRQRIALYGAVPFIGIGALAVFYYSGHPVLKSMVSPDHGKEYGLLEILQVVCLLAIVVVSAPGGFGPRARVEKIVRGGLAVLALFVAMEEIDYGAHFLGTQIPTLHGVEYIEAVIEASARVGMMIFFGAFALLFAESRNPTLRYIASDRMSVMAILIISALQEVIWRAPITEGTLASHEIEFMELGMYYLGLLYALDLARRPAPSATLES